VVDYASFVLELRPEVLPEEEVGGVIAVEVADLVPADPEGPLAAAAGAGLHSPP
jgi:hypothetical protein